MQSQPGVMPGWLFAFSDLFSMVSTEIKVATLTGLEPALKHSRNCANPAQSCAAAHLIGKMA
jgi:hypothetical protein